MSSDLFPSSALLARSEQNLDKLLRVGKIKINGLTDGFVFYLIEINFPKEKDDIIITTIESVIKKTIYKESDIFSYFEKILQRVNDSIDLLSKKNVDIWSGNFNAIIGCVQNSELIISQSGKISGYLFRKDKISTITENNTTNSPVHPLKTFTNITSGELTNNDKLLFANNDFFNCISLDRARSMVSANNPVETVNEIFKNFHNINKSHNINAIVIGVSDISIDSDPFDEIVYIDQKNETFKKLLLEKVLPLIIATGKMILIFAKSASKFIGAIFQTLRPITLKIHAKISKNINKKSKQPANYGHLNKFLKNNKAIKINDFRMNDLKTKERQDSKLTAFYSVLISVLTLIFKKKNRIFLYIILIIILGFFVFKNIREKSQNHATIKKEQELTLNYNQAKALFNKAKQDQALGKPEYSKEFSEALDLAIKAKASIAVNSDATRLIRDIRIYLDKEIKAAHLPNPDQGYAFGQNITNIFILGSEIYGINNAGKLYQFDTRDQQTSLIASIGKDKGDIVSLSGSESQAKIFIYTNKNILISYDTNTKIPTELKITDDKAWESAKSIAAFSTNIYLLDTTSNMVWRHTQTDQLYGKGNKYFGKNVDLSKTISFAVDGNLYLLDSDAKIQKYSKGSLDQEFEIKDIPGVANKIESPAKLITSEDTNYLYILDTKLNRIIQADKFGAFVSQYMFDDIKVDDFAINPKIEKFWIISGSKIYEMGL